MDLTPEDYSPRLRELIAAKRRVQARKPAPTFLEYCNNEELFPGEKPALHHTLLIKYLEMVEAGEIENLMVFMPPGSAKSTYTSMRFASWYLDKHPTDSLIQGCHTAKLAARPYRVRLMLQLCQAVRAAFT